MLIRPAEPEDALAVARVHVRSWQQAYRGLLPQDYLDSLEPEQRAPHYDFATDNPYRAHTLVAVQQESIVGFATTMPSRDQDHPDFGELCALYVEPEHWGRGVGLALSAETRNALRQQGFHDALLWVLQGNERAQGFYRRDGWISEGTQRAETLWGIMVNELRYTRRL